MCKVHIADDQAGRLRPPTPAETRKLGHLLSEGMRLSCQARTSGDVTVTVPEDPLKAAIRKKLAEQQEDDWWS
jgi:ferredoxin